MHPEDAARRGLSAGELVRVTSKRGELLLPLECRTKWVPGTVFAAMHWSGQFLASGGINEVSNGGGRSHIVPARTQARGGAGGESGFRLAPAGRAARRRARDADRGAAAAARMRVRFAHPACRCRSSFGTGLAGAARRCRDRTAAVVGALAEVLDCNPANTCWSTATRAAACSNASAGAARAQRPDRRTAVGRRPARPGQRSAAGHRPGRHGVDRVAIGGIHQRLPSGARDALVCQCMQVRESPIRAQVAQGAGVIELKQRLGCGTVCGSCLPQLTQLCRQPHRA